MRFLVDANLSPRVAEWLRENGHQAAHVFEIGLAGAPDQDVLQQATADGSIVLTSDLDFGDVLARTRSGMVVIVRLRSNVTARVTARLETALPQAAPALEGSVVVVVEEARLRIRRLRFDG